MDNQRYATTSMTSLIPKLVGLKRDFVCTCGEAKDTQSRLVGSFYRTIESSACGELFSPQRQISQC
jgi:hypothetical protein